MGSQFQLETPRAKSELSRVFERDFAPVQIRLSPIHPSIHPSIEPTIYPQPFDKTRFRNETSFWAKLVCTDDNDDDDGLLCCTFWALRQLPQLDNCSWSMDAKSTFSQSWQ